MFVKIDGGGGGEGRCMGGGGGLEDGWLGEDTPTNSTSREASTGTPSRIVNHSGDISGLMQPSHTPRRQR